MSLSVSLCANVFPVEQFLGKDLNKLTKIDIISGFLGAGKTTLIKKLLDESFKGEKIVLIENEFGEIGIDGGFLKDAGVEITEMNSGCICCSLVGDFGTALGQVLDQYSPDRIIIEPSGVGKLSDVVAAVERVRDAGSPLELNSFVTVVDALKCRVYMKNFGEFFNNQVEHACAILLSRTQGMDPVKLDGAVKLLREKNEKAAILTTPWTELTGAQILTAMEGGHSLAGELLEEIEHHHHEHEHHHHHHDHDHDHEHDHDHGAHCGCDCDACMAHEHHHHHDHEHHDHEHDHHDTTTVKGNTSITTTRTRCSLPGAAKPPVSTPVRSFRTFWQTLPPATNTALSSGQRAWSPTRKMTAGSTSTWSPASARYAAAAQITPAGCA